MLMEMLRVGFDSPAGVSWSFDKMWSFTENRRRPVNRNHRPAWRRKNAQQDTLEEFPSRSTANFLEQV